MFARSIFRRNIIVYLCGECLLFNEKKWDNFYGFDYKKKKDRYSTDWLTSCPNLINVVNKYIKIIFLRLRSRKDLVKKISLKKSFEQNILKFLSISINGIIALLKKN